MNNDTPSKEVEEKLKLPSPTIYEIIARGGMEELRRPFQSLAWSAFVAGICISFSLMCEGFFKAHAPEGQDFFLIENLGYSIGFLIVIMGRFQLFTENTITAILPLLDEPSNKRFNYVVRLWSIVLAFNMLGTFVTAGLLTNFNFFSAEQFDIFIEISRHAVDKPLWDIFIQAIPAGFLIAVLVWLLPAAEGGAQLWIIVMITYLIALGDFAHVVAGSAEAFLLMLNMEISITHGLGYLFAACAGNIIGGTCLFAVMAYAQVQREIE